MPDAQRAARPAKTRLISKPPEKWSESRARSRRLPLSMVGGVAVSAHGGSGNFVNLDLLPRAVSVAEPQNEIGPVVPYRGYLGWIAVDGDRLVGRGAMRTAECVAGREEEVGFTILAPTPEMRRGATGAVRAAQSSLVGLALVVAEVRERARLDLRTLVDSSCLHRSPGRLICTGVAGLNNLELTVLGRDPMCGSGHLVP